MKILFFLALAYIAPALLLLLFAQGWTWQYGLPLALMVINAVLAGKAELHRHRS
ncbi:MAG: hypothetical protein KA535_09750 [Azonexus sp.]|nr:hypothetical protein [Azonexus sp.]